MSNVQIIKGTGKPIRNGAMHEDKLRVAPYCRVSTDSEEQLESYKSQLDYYTKLIEDTPNWVLVDIYADEAVTGTQTKKRDDFKRMIEDCMLGKIDMIITKAISRFARNTLDTLTYVRQLKERNVAVFFEKEQINTLTADGELLLTILSSVAQQEVENISANVKMGLRAKMLEKVPIGFSGCLGLDYDKETKKISINEDGAKIVRYIFKRYQEGAGGYVIAQELMEREYKTYEGSSKWSAGSVLSIIKNVKYKGDMMAGKTYTVDPIDKKRVANKGEKDIIYIDDNHDAIIPVNIFDEVQELLKKRSAPYKAKERNKYSRQYAFSSKIYCAFCGSIYIRRVYHSGTKYEKRAWHCTNAKDGKKNCPDSKNIIEQDIEKAFVEAFRLMCSDNKDILSEFLERVETSLNENTYAKRLAAANKKVDSIKRKKDKLLELYLDSSIDKSEFDKKQRALLGELADVEQEYNELQSLVKNDSQLKKRLAEFKKVLEQNDVLSAFDPVVFESVIEKIIIGGFDEDGNKSPNKITFVFKTGYMSDGNLQERSAGRKRKPDQSENTVLSGDLLCSYTPTALRLHERPGNPQTLDCGRRSSRPCSPHFQNDIGRLRFG